MNYKDFMSKEKITEPNPRKTTRIRIGNPDLIHECF